MMTGLDDQRTALARRSAEIPPLIQKREADVSLHRTPALAASYSVLGGLDGYYAAWLGLRPRRLGRGSSSSASRGSHLGRRVASGKALEQLGVRTNRRNRLSVERHMGNPLANVRYAVRLLIKKPGFAAI